MDSEWILYCSIICHLESCVWAEGRLADFEKSPSCSKSNILHKTCLVRFFLLHKVTSHCPISKKKKFLLQVSLPSAARRMDKATLSKTGIWSQPEFQESKVVKRRPKFCRGKVMELSMVCLGKWKGELNKNFKVQQCGVERIKAVEPWSFWQNEI